MSTTTLAHLSALLPAPARRGADASARHEPLPGPPDLEQRDDLRGRWIDGGSR